jgi:lipase maturation factor
MSSEQPAPDDPEQRDTTLLSQRRVPDFLTRDADDPGAGLDGYELASWVFLRGLGLIYAIAFASLGVQILGLVGSDGILPLAEYLSAAHAGWGADAYWKLPTLLWLTQSDFALVAGAWLGVGLGLLVALGLWQRVCLIALFVLYLSYVYAGQLFMSYQWDLLLLEAGFLAIFLTGGSRIVVWLYRWLLFRFVFLAGLVKVMSGDATWQKLNALEYHFWTQPLPSPLAWYAAQLPGWLLAGVVVAVLALELVLIFLVFAPRRPRLLVACLIIAFQIAIMATGNYNWFNLLTILLCVFLLDDAVLRRAMPASLARRIYDRSLEPGLTETIVAAAVAIVTVPVGVNMIWEPLTGRNMPIAATVAETLSPLLIVNSYGVFATTTTTRPQIVIEGSRDGKEWRPYVLPYAPGPVTRAPTWNIPLQPRLDWQLWFAGYANAAQARWVERVAQRLLEGSGPVTGLFADDPFAGEAPKYVRAQIYDYKFADAGSDDWWTRKLDGVYLPRVGLENFQPKPLIVPKPQRAVPGPGRVKQNAN